MDLLLLGPIEARLDDRPISLGARKQRAMLAMLALEVGHTVSVDRLAEGLWGEHAPRSAPKLVQLYVSHLRRLLDGNGAQIVTRGRGYELRLAEGGVDAIRFERLIEESRPREALALWRGKPLADVADEPFAAAEIRRLEELRVRAAELAIDGDLAAGRHGEVVAELDALVEEHPLREHLHAQRMLALYRAGRQAEALEGYRQARALLVEQIGVEPGPELQGLHAALLEQDSALALAGPAEPLTPVRPLSADQLAVVPAPAVESSRSAFVGRERELAELVGGLDDAFAGRGRLVLVVGEPGIGKSRLAEELIACARTRGARVLVGRCWEAGGAPAYWPWVQSLRAYVRESDPSELRSQLGFAAADLGQLAPELRQHFPDLPEPPALEPEAARFRLFDATADLLRNASEIRPIVLVLDDLHAGDAPSLLLLRFLARELASIRVLIVGAYRDVDPLPGQPLTDMLAAVAREPVTSRISLGGLSESEVAEYVELTAAEIASAELIAALHGDTGGNPLFVGEIVRLLSVEGVQSDSSDEIHLAIPQSVRDVIARRLAHLSEECNRVLVLASVLGREFALDALARLRGVSEDELLEVLDEAMTARVVSDVPGWPGRLRFAHVLIRDTLYEGLTTASRMRLHRRALGALEALYGADPGPFLAELTHHSLNGRDFEKGLRYASRAADRAVALLAYEEASRLYETALDALARGDLTNEKARCRLLLSLGEAEARAGNTPAAKTAYLDAAGIARRLGLSRELALAAAGYGGRYVCSRAWGDATLVSLLEEGLAALPDDDVELRVRLLARLAGALRDEPARDHCDKLSSEALELARRAGSPAALAHALDGRACALLAPDTVSECLALGSELREVAERIGDRERMADGHFTRLMAQLQVGDISAAEIELTAASRIADELRQPTQLWEVCAARALLALAAGRLGDAEELIDQALELGGRAQPAEAIPVYRVQRYTLCDFRGSLAEVEPAMCDLAREYPARPVFRCALAHLRARLGRTEEARRDLEDLAGDGCSALPFDQEWLYGMSLLAETSALMGDTDSAPIIYGLLLPWATFNAADYLEGIRGSVARYLGLLATTFTRWSAAARHFEDALEMNAMMGARPWLAHTQNDYACMLLARGASGDRQKAQQLLSEAVPTYRKLGMPVPAASESAVALEVGRLAT
jgi:eukaryotic-like serine/threonine-protein kinase